MYWMVLRRPFEPARLTGHYDLKDAPFFTPADCERNRLFTLVIVELCRDAA
jgi:hypothetical protein